MLRRVAINRRLDLSDAFESQTGPGRERNTGTLDDTNPEPHPEPQLNPSPHPHPNPNPTLTLTQVRGMHTTLVQRHQASFKTDGKHKHGMFTGANIAKLKQSTVRALVQHAELQVTVRLRQG